MESLELETQEIEMATEKGKLYIDSYLNFEVNPNNPRSIYDVDSMKEKIRALGGIKTPILVFDKAYNVGDTKNQRVAADGNTRLYAIRELAEEQRIGKEQGLPEDQYYTGSLDVPFQILPLDVCRSQKDIKSYQLVLGTSNQQLTSTDQAKLINELVALTIQEYTEQNPGKKESKIKAAAVSHVAIITGFSNTAINQFLTIFSPGNEFVQQLVDDKVVALSYGSDMITLANKLNKKGLEIGTPELFSIAQKSALERNKASITDIDLNRVESLLEKPEIVKEFVKSDMLPFSLVNDVSELAEKYNVDPTEILSEAVEYIPGDKKAIDKKCLSSVKDFYEQARKSETTDSTDATDIIETTDSTDATDIIETTDSTESGKTVKVFTLEEQKDRIVDALLFFENLKIKGYENVLEPDIHKIANTLNKLQNSIETEEIRQQKEEQRKQKEVEKAQKLAERERVKEEKRIKAEKALELANASKI